MEVDTIMVKGTKEKIMGMIMEISTMEITTETIMDKTIWGTRMEITMEITTMVTKTEM